MQKKYNKLWVFGDSYSTFSYCVDPQQSFWGLTATTLSIENIKNYSWPGNSFESVIHNIVSLQDEYNYDNDLFLIGIPPLERLTVADDNTSKPSYSHSCRLPMWHTWTEEVLCHRGLKNIGFADDKYTAIFEERSWTVTQALRNIFLLNSWLDSKNANYLIFNLAKDFDKTDIASYNSFLLAQAITHPKNILFDKGYQSINYNINKPADYDRHGWFGHHGPAGNQLFFEKSILPALEKNNLI